MSAVPYSSQNRLVSSRDEPSDAPSLRSSLWINASSWLSATAVGGLAALIFQDIGVGLVVSVTALAAAPMLWACWQLRQPQ